MAYLSDLPIIDASDPASPARDLLILYATETGNAEDSARRIARRCRELDFHVRVISTDVYPLEELVEEPLVIFVVATTGAGKEPRAFSLLWNSLLRSDLPRDLFEDLHFGIFGLGDTAYEKFCWPAKLLQRRLEALGATAMVERGEGDDQHRLGVDGSLLSWIRDLEVSLNAMHPNGDNHSPTTYGPYPARIKIIPCPTVNVATEETLGIASTVVDNLRMTASDWEQDVRHIILRVADDVSYLPGDVAIVYPEARLEDVGSLLVTCGWANYADDAFEIEPSSRNSEDIPARIPLNTTLRQLFTRHLDFGCVPRRSFFDLIRHFAHDQMEKDKLTEFCAEDGEGADDLYEYCTRPRRTIREVLEDFHSISIPKEYILDVFPLLRPRLFSIASSLKKHPGEVHLCVAIIRYKTKLRLARTGVCTSYLSNLQSGAMVRIDIQKGDMRLPPSSAIPIIGIGPGTGVAPMRALLEDRAVEDASDNTLYFGCRSAAKDQHFARDWDTMAKDGKLVYRLAASRDGEEGKARTYVQHLIEQDSKKIYELVHNKKAWVYISGSANKMPIAVKRAMQDALEKEGEMGEEDANRYIRQMETEGRLVEECWS